MGDNPQPLLRLADDIATLSHRSVILASTGGLEFEQAALLDEAVYNLLQAEKAVVAAVSLAPVSKGVDRRQKGTNGFKKDKE
mgnify:CR=1 FL=1